ncbi:GspE/PulE/PilB domain-containing protein [Stieleria varia]|uniref:GspE/PulE/PilB domain-containing protein n=1 Tax=Stieleria varia TaxID=2528005 RepID=UPI0011B35F94|nr:hypothetical protein [Stieleria varia]
MDRLSNVYLPQSIVDIIPENVARDYCVIAISIRNGLLTIACPANDFDSDAEKLVEFILNRNAQWIRFPCAEIADAIDRHYIVDGAILDCRFSDRCPQRWRDLAETDVISVRHCITCDEDIHLCYSRHSLPWHNARDHRIAIVDATLPR